MKTSEFFGKLFTIWREENTMDLNLKILIDGTVRDIVDIYPQDNDVVFRASQQTDLFDILNREIEEKSLFVDECIENDDLQNGSYWNAFVHGVKFARDVITEQADTADAKHECERCHTIHANWEEAQHCCTESV